MSANDAAFLDLTGRVFSDKLIRGKPNNSAGCLLDEAVPPGSPVINISSKASVRPTPWTVVYAAAKAGQNALTKAAAAEFGPKGVRVNAMVCGMLRTDSLRQALTTTEAERRIASQLSLGRIAGPEEIVETALYLDGDASSYLTGELIMLDRGGS
jgi:NAD(P)-dependent dehydrogenase (short-subunit alcohol dehydrogenase family)